MPVYRATMKGRRKPILIKAESSAKARDALVDCESLTAEEMADALCNGEQIWVPGTDLPADEPDPAESGPGDQPKAEAKNDAGPADEPALKPETKAKGGDQPAS